MSWPSKDFRLFHVSNVSVLNFLIFLLMYPGSEYITSSSQSSAHGAAPAPRPAYTDHWNHRNEEWYTGRCHLARFEISILYISSSLSAYHPIFGLTRSETELPNPWFSGGSDPPEPITYRLRNRLPPFAPQQPSQTLSYPHRYTCFTFFASLARQSHFCY